MFPRVLSKKIPPFHNEIYSLLANQEVKKRAILAPRGHSKSTLGSFVYPMYKALFKDPEEPRFIVIVSESQDQAVNFLSNIKMALEENPRIRYYFGDLVGDLWTQDDIILKNKVRIKAIGTRQRVRGINFLSKRPTDIILDDFESELNSLTPENRHRNMDWVAGAIEPSLDDDGVLTCIGTIVHEGTYLNGLRKDPRFEVLFYEAIMDGESIWPERFPKERMEQIRESYRARGLIHMYYQEYFNQPRNPEEQAFKQQDIQHYDGDITVKDGQSYISLNQPDGTTKEKPVNVYCGVDLAISSRGDFSVIVPLAVDADENLYVGDYFRKRVEPDRIIDELFQFRFRYNPQLFVIETTAYQQALITFLRKAMVERGIHFPIKEVKPRLAKDIRLMSLQPFFVANKIFLKRRHTELEEELLAFPRGKHDDLLDGLHNAASFAVRAAPNQDAITTNWEYFSAPSWRVL